MFTVYYRNAFLGETIEHQFSSHATREAAEAVLQDLIETWSLLDIQFEVRENQFEIREN